MKRTMLVLVLLLALSVPCLAAEWVECYSGSAGATYWFDATTVSVDASDVLRFKMKIWQGGNDKTYSLADMSFKKSPALFYRLENMTMYWMNGKPFGGNPYSEGWRRVTPYSDTETIYLNVTDYLARRDKK